MKAERGSIAGLIAELAPLTLILLAMGGMLTLIILIHQRHLDRSKLIAALDPPQTQTAPAALDPVVRTDPSAAALDVQPPIPIEPEPELEPDPPPAPAPKPEPKPQAVEDPTLKAVRAILSRADGEAKLANEARKWGALASWAKDEASRLAETWAKDREAEATQVRETERRLESRLQSIKAQAETLAAERDRLATDRERAKREWLETKDRPRRAVVPYQGPNGTVKIPIAIDCQDDKVVILPDGPAFSMEDLSPYWGGAAHPFAVAAGMAAGKIKQDGKTPYVLFLVRPDGIRAYYEARARLQSLGIAFGYELVDQDWAIDARAGETESPSAGARERPGGDPIVWKLADLSVAEAKVKTEANPDAGVSAGAGVPRFAPPSPIGGGWVSNAQPGRPAGAGGPSSGTGTVIRMGSAPRSGPGSRGQAEPAGSGSPGAAIGSGSAPADPGGSGQASGGPGGQGDEEGGDAGPSVRTITVVATCGPRGLTIRSEGLRIPLANLKAGDQRWLTHLRKVIQASQYLDPRKSVRARLQILIEPGGEETYAAVRGQTLFSDWEWPVELTVAPPDRPNPFLRGGY